MKDRKKIIIIYPYRFREFDTQRFEIECLKNHCDVVVHELIEILHSQFKVAYHNYDKSTFIQRFSSLLEWRAAYLEAVKSCDTKPYIINFVSTSTIKELFVNYILSSSDVFLIKFQNPGYPGYQGIDSIFSRIKTKYKFIIKRATFKSLRFSFFSIFCRYLGFLFCRKNDYTLGVNIQTNKIKNRKININSFDFSMFIGNNNNKLINSNNNFIVYLDTGAPLFKTDAFLYGNKHPLSIDAWYPKLTDFFDIIEKKTSKTVVIAAHPKHQYSSDMEHYFGNRRIFHSKTEELIAESELVLVTNSTAVSYAVMHSKPVIVLVSDELLRDNNVLIKDAKNLSEILDSAIVNINDIDENLLTNFTVNKIKYLDYKSKYLSSRLDDKTNCEIIIDEVIYDKKFS